MELFLNLLWVLIAASAVGLWRICWRPQSARERREPLREWTAMSCSLILLFFAVSLTDDLHSEVMLLEECSTSRRQSMNSHHSQQTARAVHEGGSAVLPNIVRLDPLRICCGISSIPIHLSPSAWREFSSGRAPPIANL
jgi:hypothetical protein